MCLALAGVVLWVAELRKLVIRAGVRWRVAGGAEPSGGGLMPLGSTLGRVSGPADPNRSGPAVQRPGDRCENIFTVKAAGGMLYVTAQAGCSGDQAPMTLTAHDPSAGTSTVIAPAPEGSWVDGLTGWVVAE